MHKTFNTSTQYESGTAHFSGFAHHFLIVISMEQRIIVYIAGASFLSGDLHICVEDLWYEPDTESGAHGEQSGEALRRHPHPADVDALQFRALVHQRHQPGLRHVAAAPQYDALHNKVHGN